MAISRKPTTPENSKATPIDVEALIAKGGSVALKTVDEPTEEPKPEITSFTLRVPNDLLKLADEQRKKGAYKVPRQQWILEAIMQRLEREHVSLSPTLKNVQDT